MRDHSRVKVKRGKWNFDHKRDTELAKGFEAGNLVQGC